MALFEQWNDYGTAGRNGWVFTGMTGTVGTYGGGLDPVLTCITGWQDIAGTEGNNQIAYVPCALPWDGSVYSWRAWIGTDYAPCVMLGANSSGTMLGFAPYQATGKTFVLYNSGGTIGLVSQGGAGTDSCWVDVTVTYTTTAGTGTWTAVSTSKYGTGTKTYEGFTRIATGYPSIRGCRYNSEPMTPNGITELMYPLALPQSIFDFVGTFNDGSNWGTEALGDITLSISDVREQSYEPNNTRGWVSAASVALDNCGGEWSEIAGQGFASSSNNAVWTLGTFFARQTWDGGSTYTTLLTGYVSPDSVTEDYANQTVTLQVNSVLGRVADNLIPYDPQFMGTVSDLTDGTVTLMHTDSTMPHIYEREYLWEGTGTTGNSVRIEALPGNGTWGTSSGTYTGLVYLRETPDWLTAGGSVYRTESIGSLAWNGPYYWRSAIYAIGTQLGLSCYIPRQSAVYMEMYNYTGTGARYYGGERWVEVLHDITSSIGLSYGVDGTGGLSVHVPYPRPAADATIDFRTAYNDAWTINYAQAIKSVTVETVYNPEERRYDAESIAMGDVAEGQVLAIEAPWLESDLYGRALAYRTLAMGAYPLGRLSLALEGSLYGSYAPSSTVAVSNLPVYGMSPLLTVAARTYDYAEDLVTLDLVEQRTYGVFTFDKSTWGGTDMWW